MQTESSQNTGRMSDDGKTSAPSRPDPLLIGKSILFAAAFRARTLATPDAGPVLAVNEAVYSTKLCESYAYWNQDTLCWKTWQRCLLEGWTLYSGRWPRSGTMRNGIVYRLPPLVPRISGTGSSLWPTPTTQEVEHPNAELTTTGRRKTPNNRSHSLNLADIVRRSLNDGDVLPLNLENATAQNVKGSVNVRRSTPRAADAERGGRGDLLQQVRSNPSPSGRYKIWPTPSDSKTSGMDTLRFQSLDVKVRDGKTSEQVGGQLNPTWVEWLMGFPIGWTDLDA